MEGRHYDYYPLAIQGGVIICDRPGGKKEGKGDLCYLYNGCINTLEFKNDNYIKYLKTVTGSY